MEVITLERIKQKNYGIMSVALGAFDGLHIGHMALLNAAAGVRGKSAVLTFEPLPAEYFGGRSLRLFTKEEKIAAFEKAGVDIMCVARFDGAFAQITSEEYEKMIAGYFSPSVVVAGYNYKYGLDARGDAESLKRAGGIYGFDVKIIPPVIYGGQTVSASRIRLCLEEGDVALAASLLGRPYALSGTVGCGRGIGGSKLGFPTANLCVPARKIIPKVGVYAVDIYHGGDCYKGVCNIGYNPTVTDNNNQKSVEIHILSLAENIYDHNITAHFIKRLRDEKKFGGVEELKAQIKRDIRSVLNAH
ncbi:MAG: bifunctional riboflavin kinase/FAD synthetase [Christensenellales bacterium]